MPQINRFRLSAATVALLAAVSLTEASATAQPAAYIPPPGAAAPWAGTSTTTTTTETKTDTSPATTPAPSNTQSTPVADTGATTTPDQTAATPMQGTTTPTHAVFLHSAPIAGSPVIGTARPGMELRVLASASPGWTQVETPTGTGWAWSSYLAPANPPAPQ